MQGSIAQLSDYDPFHFSGGLDGGVKVSGGDNFAAPDNEIRHLPASGVPYFRHDASSYQERIQRVMRIDHGWRQGKNLPPVFWAMAVICQRQSDL
ncbi:MAG TPA: hypothetical protein VGB27_06465 [Candidatus Binatia bacterium]